MWGKARNVINSILFSNYNTKMVENRGETYFLKKIIFEDATSNVLINIPIN